MPGTGAGGRLTALTPTTPRTLSQGYIRNARAISAGGNTVTVGTAGLVSTMRDSADSLDITFTGVLTADLSLSGAGGLDIGVEAPSTWYAVHVIADREGVLPVAAMFSLSATAPTLPAGYDVFRRVSWARNDPASAILAYDTRGRGSWREIEYLDSIGGRNILAAGGNVFPLVAVSVAAFVPPTSIRGYFLFRESGAAALMGRDPGAVVLIGMLTGNEIVSTLPTTAAQAISYGHLLGGGALDIWVLGWFDEL